MTMNSVSNILKVEIEEHLHSSVDQIMKKLESHFEQNIDMVFAEIERLYFAVYMDGDSLLRAIMTEKFFVKTYV